MATEEEVKSGEDNGTLTKAAFHSRKSTIVHQMFLKQNRSDKKDGSRYKVRLVAKEFFWKEGGSQLCWDIRPAALLKVVSLRVRSLCRKVEMFIISISVRNF